MKLLHLNEILRCNLSFITLVDNGVTADTSDTRASGPEVIQRSEVSPESHTYHTLILYAYTYQYIISVIFIPQL